MNEAMGLPVTLCTVTHILSGSIYLYDDERLLDVLNGESTRRIDRRGRVLELTDVTIYKSDGKEENLPTVYVNKPAICLAATWNSDAGRGIGAMVGPKPYPFIEKLAVPVSVQLPRFSLTGNMHCTRGQMACHLLEETATFLPITNVEVHPLANGIWSNVPFVAANREQILSLQQEEIPLLRVERSQPS